MQASAVGAESSSTAGYKLTARWSSGVQPHDVIVRLHFRIIGMTYLSCRLQQTILFKHEMLIFSPVYCMRIAKGHSNLRLTYHEIVLVGTLPKLTQGMNEFCTELVRMVTL